MSTGFTPSEQKVIIRDEFDLPLIRTFSKSKNRTLGYFGLPGPKASDLRAWKDVLHSAVAVERNPKAFRRMQETLRVHLEEIECDVHLGELDGIIISNAGEEQESDGETYCPPVGNVYDSEINDFVWQFDVVYLDYFGSFLPEGANESSSFAKRRATAIRRLFDRSRLDAWGSWLLLITVGTAMGAQMSSVIRQYVGDAWSEAEGKTKEALDFALCGSSHTSEGRARLIRGAASVLISAAAGNAGLRVLPRGAVLYRGSGEHDMLHLAYEFRTDSSPLGFPSGPLPLLRSPLLFPDPEGNPSVRLSPDQYPEITTEDVRRCLDFLGKKHPFSLLKVFTRQQALRTNLHDRLGPRPPPPLPPSVNGGAIMDRVGG